MKKWSSVLLLFISIILAGCGIGQGKQVMAIPTINSPQLGMGSLIGKVVATISVWPQENELFIFAAPFIGKGDEGFYTLQPDLHPKSRLGSGGTFQIEQVPAGRYILVVGPSAEEGRLVINAAGKPRIVDARSGEVTDLGELMLAQ